MYAYFPSLYLFQNFPLPNIYIKLRFYENLKINLTFSYAELGTAIICRKLKHSGPETLAKFLYIYIMINNLFKISYFILHWSKE